MTNNCFQYNEKKFSYDFFLLNQENEKRIIHDKLCLTCMKIMFYPYYPIRKMIIHSFTRDRFINLSVNDLQDKPEGLDVSVLSKDSVSGLPVAPHPYG